jgi:tetratricopeptide (TPR) repeat protein
MKKIAIILLMGICQLSIAQVELKTPPPSPEAEWKQKVGFTEISVKYERPLMRGRKIFGALVPFDQIWRTGAGESTRIRFSDDIKLGGQAVKKGYYSIFTIPNPSEWTIILNTDTTSHGAFSYDEKKDVFRIKVKPETTARVYESFSISLEDIMADYSANLYLNWENTQVKIPIQSNADAIVMNEINTKINIEKLEDAKFFNNAAQYYFANKKDLKQALGWSKKSEELVNDNYSYANLTTKILEEQKDYGAAITSAQKTIELASKKNMKAVVENWQKKVAEWQKITGVVVPASNTMTANNNDNHSHTGHNMSSMNETQAQTKSTLQPLLTAYYAIKNALVASDASASAVAAGTLVSAMKSVDMGKMEMKQHMEFMKVNTKIIADAQKIAALKDLKKQREIFQSLSDNFYTMAKGVKLSSEPIYQQYCPMKKAAWLSNESAVKNPYYGSSMLTCGSVTDTIK